jgi:hypothetical protein
LGPAPSRSQLSSQTLGGPQGLWTELKSRNYPPLIVERMTNALGALSRAVARKDVAATSQSAIGAAQSELDLELLYRGNVEVDTFHLHAQQLRVHAAANDLAGVSAEVAALEWIRNRLAGRVSDGRLARLDVELGALRNAADAKNLPAAADHAARAAAGLRRG